MADTFSTPDEALETAQALIEEGKLEDALPALTFAIEGFDEADEYYGLVLALKVASETNRDLANLDIAVQEVERAYHVLQEIKPSAAQVGDFATETGSIFAQMGWLDESEEWYTAGAREYAAHGRTDDYAHNMVCLAGVYRQRGDEQTARSHLVSAITVVQGKEPVNQLKLAEIHLDMAHSLMAEGKLENAEDHLNQVLTFAAVSEAHALMGEGFQGMAIVKAQLGDRSEAAANARRAVGAFETAGDADRADFARHILERTL